MVGVKRINKSFRCGNTLRVFGINSLKNCKQSSNLSELLVRYPHLGNFIKDYKVGNPSRTMEKSRY